MVLLLGVPLHTASLGLRVILQTEDELTGTLAATTPLRGRYLAALHEHVLLLALRLGVEVHLDVGVAGLPDDLLHLLGSWSHAFAAAEDVVVRRIFFIQLHIGVDVVRSGDTSEVYCATMILLFQVFVTDVLFTPTFNFENFI